MRNYRETGGVILIGVLALFAGCNGAGANRPSEAPQKTAPPAQSNAASEPGPQDKDAPEEFTTTASGLNFRILRKSDGTKPTASSRVSVHYRGWLDDGTEFDSSYKRGEPTSFPLNGVIPGWTEGLQLVGQGGMIELEIPGDLAYGPDPDPRSGIPPNARLHFIVELLEVR